MKATITAAAVAAATLLAACAQSGHGHHAGHNHAHNEHHKGKTADTSAFKCDNGLNVNVGQAGEDKIRVIVEGNEAVLTLAPSGSGERYVGKVGEWHQKGGEAHFTYTGLNGKNGQTACYQGKK